MKKRIKALVSFFMIISLVLPVICIGTYAAGDLNISTLHPAVDNNSFDNTAEAFTGKDERSKYYIDASQFNKLTEGENEDTKNLIMSQVLSKFDGADYGIASTMALVYTGVLDLQESNYYSVDISENTDFRNTVNYYNLAQFCVNKSQHQTVAVSGGKIFEDSLKQTVEYAKNGMPYLIFLRTDGAAHTVTACGYEYGEDSVHRIRILDCNKKEDFAYLCVSPFYNEWSLEGLDYSTEDIIYLAFSTLDVFTKFKLPSQSDVIYSTVPGSVHIDTVCTNISSSFTLVNEEGESLTFDEGEFSGEIQANAVKYISTSGKDGKTKIVFTVPDSNFYTVQVNGEEIDLTVVGDRGLFFTVQGKNIRKITGTVGQTVIEGENMEYSVNALSTEDNVEMVNVCGADPQKVTFSTNDGMTVKGSENGKIYTSIISDGKIYEKTFGLNHGEKVIKYAEMIKKTNPVSKDSSVMKNIVLVFISVVFLITLAVTIKKYAAKKTSGKKGETENG